MPISEEEITGPKQRISKKNIVIIFAVLLLFIVVTYWYAFPGPVLTYNQTVKLQSIISSCIISERGKDDISWPFINSDIKLCESYKDKNNCEFIYYNLNILGGFYFNNCNDIYNEEAKIICETAKNNDVSNCEKLSTQEYKITCKAIVSNDISICDLLTNEKDQKQCSNSFHVYKGILSKDLNECENIQELEEKYEYSWFDSQKQWCRNVVSKDLSFYEEKLEDRCNDEIAAMFNTTFCYILKSGNEIQSCKDKINSIFDCTNESDPKSCIDNIINIAIFCHMPYREFAEVGIYYNKFKFLKENPNICPPPEL